MGTFVSISGGSNAPVHIYGNGSVAAGNGNDTIRIDGNGNITVGAGHDNLTLNGSGYIFQHNSGSMVGNDTINLGSGNDTLSEAGSATVHGAFGSATVEGGVYQYLQHKTGCGDNGGHSGSNAHGASAQYIYQEFAISGKATMVGGSASTQFMGGSGSVVMQGGSGNDTFIGGSGQTTMTGGTAQNLFEISCRGKGGTDVITNFVSGHDQLYLEGKSLGYLQSHGDISVSHGNTYISLDGGHTTVELKGFTGLTSADISHKG
jgi:Ca2+-binding RTX toxin-like protein